MESKEYATSEHRGEIGPALSSEKIKIKIKFFTTLRELTKKREEEFEISDHASMKDVIDLVSRKYGQQVNAYLHENGQLRRHFQILIDGKNINQDKGLTTPVYANCVIAILPPAGGG